MADTLLFAQLQPFTLAGAGLTIGDSTIVLTSMKDINGVALAMTDFGTIGFGTLEPGNGIQEEQISFSGLTQNSNGTATLTGVKTVLMKAPYTQTANVTKSHPGGGIFVISNTAGFYDSMTSKANDETITGLYTFSQTPIIPVAAPTLDTQAANKKYVDDTAAFGAPLMATSTAGIGQEATDTQINAGTQAGSTLAELVVNPKYLKDSIYYTQLPSSDQKAALAGTGTPAVGNKFVTNDTLTTAQALDEKVANKDTTVTLGGSDTKYPSQNAVKTYVDTQDAKFGAWTYDGELSLTTLTQTYTLSTTYDVVMFVIQCTASGQSSAPDVGLQLNGDTNVDDYTFVYMTGTSIAAIAAGTKAYFSLFNNTSITGTYYIDGKLIASYKRIYGHGASETIADQILCKGVLKNNASNLSTLTFKNFGSGGTPILTGKVKVFGMNY